MNRLAMRAARLLLRNAFLKRVAHALVARIPFLRRRAQMLVAQGALRQAHYHDGQPLTPGDLSPRSARCLAELVRARDKRH